MGKPQQIFGTYPYMPPEQVNPPRGGQATVLPTTDIFSFGVMMYELMVGRLPFGELNEATLGKYLYNGKNGIWDRTPLERVLNSDLWKRIIGEVFPENLASARVLEKNGFRLEETKAEAIVKGGKAMDVRVYVKA